MDRALIGRSHQILTCQMTNMADIWWPLVTQLIKVIYSPRVWTGLAPHIQFFLLSKRQTWDAFDKARWTTWDFVQQKTLRNQDSCHCLILSLTGAGFCLPISWLGIPSTKAPPPFEDLRDKFKGQEPRASPELTCNWEEHSMKHLWNSLAHFSIHIHLWNMKFALEKCWNLEFW